MFKNSIPFNRACIMGNERLYMAEAIVSGEISGDGDFTRKCQNYLEKELGASKILLTTSCTHALEMAALLLRIEPGDEVILPSFTFVSTANAFVLRGARPVFIDIHSDTLNLDESKLERLITSHTKAIIPVHFGGVGCEMDTILEIANKHGIAVVEDNAHGLFGKYKNQYLGSFGGLAALSFEASKNFTCGQGGALIINDPQFIERAEMIYEKGTDRSRFFRGQVDKYTWVDLGSNYRLSEILSAFLYGQLESREKIQAERRRIWAYYYANLKDWAQDHDLRIPFVPRYCEPADFIFYLIMLSLEHRQAMIQHLKARGIPSSFFYQPLHLSAMGRKLGGKEGDCPVTEEISNRLLRLPFYNGLTDEAQEQVISALREFKGFSV